MLNVEELVRLPDDAYRPDVTSEVYRRLDDKARRAVSAGSAVVIDATFATRSARVAAARVAAEVGVAFDGVFLQAPLPVRLARVASRQADASDADAAVAKRQEAEPLGERGWRTIDASGALETTVAHAVGRLGLQSRPTR